MSEPKGYDPAKIGQANCPEEWLEYFLDCSDYDEEDEPVISNSKVKNQSRYRDNLFNVTEEQVENPNYWINL